MTTADPASNTSNTNDRRALCRFATPQLHYCRLSVII
jgi:hypothetical protein